MYSYEIDEYIKQHNYRLDTASLQFIMDIREHPQISHIKFNSYDNSYDIWTSDSWHFHFDTIPYSEYIEHVKKIVQNEEDKMKHDHFRLYASLESKPYLHIATSVDIKQLFTPLDVFILQNETKHSKYLIVHNIDDADTLLYLGYGDKLDYLQFKERMLNPEKETNKSKVYKK